MTPQTLALIAFAFFSIIILAFAFVVLWKIINNTISLDGLVAETPSGGVEGKASLSRFQFLLFTFVIAGLFLLLSIESGTFVTFGQCADPARLERRHLCRVEDGHRVQEEGRNADGWRSRPCETANAAPGRTRVMIRALSVVASVIAAFAAMTPVALAEDATDPDTCKELWERSDRATDTTPSRMGRDTTAVCHSRYLVMHNYDAKTPDWVLERLTRAQISGTNKRRR